MKFNNQSRILYVVLWVRYPVCLCRWLDAVECCSQRVSTSFLRCEHTHTLTSLLHSLANEDTEFEIMAKIITWIAPSSVHITCACSSISSAILIVINFKSSFVAHTRALPRLSPHRTQFPWELICIKSFICFREKSIRFVASSIRMLACRKHQHQQMPFDSTKSTVLINSKVCSQSWVCCARVDLFVCLFVWKISGIRFCWCA